MSKPLSNIRYNGTALPTNAQAIVLFDTTIAVNVTDPAQGASTHLAAFLTDTAAKRALSRGYLYPRNFFAGKGIKRFLLSLTMSHDVTLVAYRSVDRGVTWVQYDSDAVTASGATGISDHDYLVESFEDWKLVMTSGGNQTTFVCNMSLSDERGLAA